MIGDSAYGSRDNKGGTGIGDRAKEPHHGKRGAVRELGERDAAGIATPDREASREEMNGYGPISGEPAGSPTARSIMQVRPKAAIYNIID